MSFSTLWYGSLPSAQSMMRDSPLRMALLQFADSCPAFCSCRARLYSSTPMLALTVMFGSLNLFVPVMVCFGLNNQIYKCMYYLYVTCFVISNHSILYRIYKGIARIDI